MKVSYGSSQGLSQPQPGAGQPQPWASATSMGTGWDVGLWVSQGGWDAPGIPAQELVVLRGLKGDLGLWIGLGSPRRAGQRHRGLSVPSALSARGKPSYQHCHGLQS